MQKDVFWEIRKQIIDKFLISGKSEKYLKLIREIAEELDGCKFKFEESTYVGLGQIFVIDNDECKIVGYNKDTEIGEIIHSVDSITY